MNSHNFNNLSKSNTVNLQGRVEFSHDFDNWKPTISMKDLQKQKQVSIWQKMRQLNQAARSSKANSKYSKLKQALFPLSHREKISMRNNALFLSSKSKTQNRSNHLFLQWRAELEKFTDIHPVNYCDPPLSLTKIEEFTFRSTSRDRSSLSKDFPMAISQNISNKKLLSKPKSSKRKNQILSEYYKICEDENFQGNRDHYKLDSRSSLAKRPSSRPRTKQEQGERFATYNLYLSPQRPNDKFKMNFDMVMMDNAFPIRPVLNRNSLKENSSTKHENVRFKNIFVF